MPEIVVDDIKEEIGCSKKNCTENAELRIRLSDGSEVFLCENCVNDCMDELKRNMSRVH